MKTRLAQALRRTLSIAAVIIAIAGQQTQALELNSKTIKPQQTLNMSQVFNGFGCQGQNQSPDLSWTDVPKGTKSFAITAYDPDAPTGSGWWHWVVFNIPADATALATDAGNISKTLMPDKAIQSRTDFGSYGYGGACPPKGHGKHRYQFTIHALDTESLALDKNTSSAMVGYMLNQHRLGMASIEAVFERK